MIADGSILAYFIQGRYLGAYGCYEGVQVIQGGLCSQ